MMSMNCVSIIQPPGSLKDSASTHTWAPWLRTGAESKRASVSEEKAFMNE